MQSKLVRFAGSFIFLLTLLGGAQLPGIGSASAQPHPAPPPGPPPQSTPPPPGFIPPPPNQPSPLETLQWDTIMKEASPVAGQATADFVFKVSNPTEKNVVIERVQTSCGCTVAKLPAQPWVLTPHTNGQIDVTVNLAGKSGTIWKTITVYSTNNIQKILTVKVNMPENPEAMRMRNQAMAANDPQMIFKGDCAKCHVEKSKGLLGKALYKESCGICHDANPRASMVTDLHTLKQGGYDYWKQIITYGKPKTMMPGFSVKTGGPLTDEQVESLAKVLTLAFTPTSSTSATTVPLPINTSATPPVPGAHRLPPPPHPPANQN